MVCDVAEMASGVGVVWVRRDGAVVPVAVGVPALVASAVLAAMVSSALSMLTALVPVDVAVLSSAVSVVAFVLVPSSALSASLLVASAFACCPAVAGD